MNIARHRGTRLTSYSWAELGSMFRNARIAGNESLAARLKQAVEMKKAIRNFRKKGIDPTAGADKSDTTES